MSNKNMKIELTEYQRRSRIEALHAASRVIATNPTSWTIGGKKVDADRAIISLAKCLTRWLEGEE